MASDNEKVKASLFDLTDSASDVISNINNLLEQKDQTPDQAIHSINIVLLHLDRFYENSRNSEIYKKLKNADEYIDPCIGVGYYLNELRSDIDHLNEIWYTNGPEEIGVPWHVTPPKMKEGLSKIRDKFNAFSYYAGKCAAKFKD